MSHCLPGTVGVERRGGVRLVMSLDIDWVVYLNEGICEGCWMVVKRLIEDSTWGRLMVMVIWEG